MIQRGDQVKIAGIEYEGVVTMLHVDNTATVELCNGMTLRTPLECITIEKTTKENRESNTRKDRDEKGRFLPGNRPVPHKKTSVKEIRNMIRERLSPFIEDIDTIIDQIDVPQDKVLAIARMMKFCVPTLSSVDLKDNNARNLNAEQKLAKLNAEYHKTKDPTEELNEEEEE